MIRRDIAYSSGEPFWATTLHKLARSGPSLHHSPRFLVHRVAENDS